MADSNTLQPLYAQESRLDWGWQLDSNDSEPGRRGFPHPFNRRKGAHHKTSHQAKSFSGLSNGLKGK